MNNNRISAGRLAELSLMTAAALIIFIVELKIPPLTPTPYIKPGLANIITVCCVYRYKPWETAMVVAVRVFLGTVFASSFTTIIFSASGAFLCLAGMIPFSWLFQKIPIWVCSIVGAILHNIGQIAAAVVYTGSAVVLTYLPFMLIGGCIAGAFTGICSQLILKRIKK